MKIQENVESTLSDLDVILQRRTDLIPNLVSTVKDYVSHEEVYKKNGGIYGQERK